MAPTNTTPAECGLVVATASSAATPTTRATADSYSWVGTRRVPSHLSEDQRPHRDAVGRPAQHPPKKHPNRPIVIANSIPGALTSSSRPADSPATLAPTTRAPSAPSTKP